SCRPSCNRPGRSVARWCSGRGLASVNGVPIGAGTRRGFKEEASGPACCNWSPGKLGVDSLRETHCRLPHGMRGICPMRLMPSIDWLRALLLVLGLGLLAWLLVTRYSSESPWEPYRRRVNEFLDAARARDTSRLRNFVRGEAPLLWALAAEDDVLARV